VSRAIAKPTHDMPVLRRVIAVSSARMRLQAFDEPRIRAVLTQVIEDVARARHMDDRSLLTGTPRWHALVERLDGWLVRESERAG